MIWIALYSTITFGLSVVVFISYLIILYKIRVNKKKVQRIKEYIDAQKETRLEQLDEMRKIQEIIESSFYVNQFGEIQWLKK